MMATPDNLRSLHEYEETLRANSLAAIAVDVVLSDHLQAVNDALDHLIALQQADSTPGDDRSAFQTDRGRCFSGIVDDRGARK